MFTCNKKFSDYAAAHRNAKDKGHCALIHGHNFAFDFSFACRERDERGWVVDFGNLVWLKSLLANMFDHTLLLNIDDPAVEYFKHVFNETATTLAKGPFANVRVIENCSCEGIAEFLFEEVDRILRATTKTDAFPKGRAFLHGVTVYEDSKNSASFFPVKCSHE